MTPIDRHTLSVCMSRDANIATILSTGLRYQMINSLFSVGSASSTEQHCAAREPFCVLQMTQVFSQTRLTKHQFDKVLILNCGFGIKQHMTAILNALPMIYLYLTVRRWDITKHPATYQIRQRAHFRELDPCTGHAVPPWNTSTVHSHRTMISVNTLIDLSCRSPSLFPWASSFCSWALWLPSSSPPSFCPIHLGIIWIYNRIASDLWKCHKWVQIQSSFRLQIWIGIQINTDISCPSLCTFWPIFGPQVYDSELHSVGGECPGPTVLQKQIKTLFIKQRDSITFSEWESGQSVSQSNDVMNEHFHFVFWCIFT